MKTAQQLAEEFPEQNPGNFEHDAALRLNDWGIEAHAMLIQQAEQIESLKADAERYRWLKVNAYVGIAPHPKPHEVWCLRLPNPKDCNNIDAAIDAHAMLIQQAEQIDQLEVERLRLVGEVSNRNIRALEGDKSTAAFNTLCDEYEALRLESLQLKAALRWQPASGMLESIEALSNENLALKADAERYRHLRATTNWVSNSKGQRIDVRKSPELLDAAIDAMKGKS